jgi:hypothetical protein
MADQTWYETVRSITRDDDLFRPEPWARARAVRLFEEEGGKRGAAARIAKALAQLVYDSMERLSFAGARLSGAGGRQLIYHADGYNIDIQIAPSTTSGAEIMGQVLREGESGFGSVAELFVDLTGSQKDSYSTMTNGFGEFMINEVDFGHYDLRIEAGDKEITVAGLPVTLP